MCSSRVLLVSLRTQQNSSLSFWFLVTKYLACARFLIVRLRLISLFYDFGFVFTYLRLFQKATHWLTAPLKITWRISQDLLMSLAVDRLLQSEFASKFLNFTKSTRRKSRSTFSLLLLNTLFIIFSLNIIKRWSLVLNSRPIFRSVTKSSQVDGTRFRILLSLVGLLTCWCNSLYNILLYSRDVPMYRYWYRYRRYRPNIWVSVSVSADLLPILPIP